MKCIVLCGGYAKRLWPLTKITPKPLLDINGRPLLDIILGKLRDIPEITEIVVSTNTLFAQQFQAWCNEQGKDDRLKLVIEPTKEENEKFGTIAGLQYVIESCHIDEDCIVIAGDNLFDYRLEDFIAYYSQKRAPVLAVFDIKDRTKAQIYGIATIDTHQRVVDFIEKPANPPSTLAASCCYLFPRDVLPLFSVYLKEGNRKDSPGFFIDWLRRRRDVYAFVFDGHWFDIGDFESLEKARAFMKTVQ